MQQHKRSPVPCEWNERLKNTRTWSGSFDSYIEPEIAQLDISVSGICRKDIDDKFCEDIGGAFADLLSRIEGREVETVSALPQPDIDWTIRNDS